MRNNSPAANAARSRAVGLLLALVTMLVYLPAVFNDFIVLDDETYVSKNDTVLRGLTASGLKWAFTTSIASNWHPLTWISHMADVNVFGPGPIGPHAVNVLLHAVNAVLLFMLLKELTGAQWRSAFVAGLFALHPLHVESVAWVAERKDVLSTLFWFLAMLFYGRYAAAARAGDGKKGLWYRLAAGSYLLGLMSKPMLVTGPFVLLLLDYWPLRRIQGTGVRGGLRLVWEKAPFLALSAASCVVTFWAQRQTAVVPVGLYPVGARLANAVVSYGRYLADTVWPANLAVMYPLPAKWPMADTVLSSAVLLGISVLVWRARRQCPYCLMGWLWYLGTLVPVIGLVQVGPQAMADRYTYVPLVGIFIAAAFGFHDLTGRFKVSATATSALAGVVLAACLVTTELQLRYWADTEQLMTRAIRVTKHNLPAHCYLAAYFAGKHRWNEAASEYREILRSDPAAFFLSQQDVQSNISTRLALAQVFEAEGRNQEALEQYREALRLDPGRLETHNNLGSLLDKMGRPEDALAECRETVRLDPDSSLARNNLGAVLAELGRIDEAISEYEVALRIKPQDPRAHYLKGRALLLKEQPAKAVAEFREAVRLDPSQYQTLTYLARVLAAAPEPEIRDGCEAIQLAESANRLSGGAQPFVLDTLAMAYAESGRFDDALRTAQTAVDIAQPAGLQRLAADLRLHIQAYRAGQPWRETFANPPSATESVREDGNRN